MNTGGGFPRIAASALDLDRYHGLFGTHPWLVERRDADGWSRVGIYGSLSHARAAVDELVGEGHGTLDDYEIEALPAKRIWPKIALAVGLLLLAIVLFTISYAWLVRP